MSDGEVRPFLEKHIKNYFKFLLTYHQNAFFYLLVIIRIVVSPNFALFSTEYLIHSWIIP